MTEACARYSVFGAGRVSEVWRQRKPPGFTGGHIRRGFTLLDVSRVESLAKPCIELGTAMRIFEGGMSASERVLMLAES